MESIFDDASQIDHVELVVTFGRPEVGIDIEQVGVHLDGRRESNTVHVDFGDDLCSMAAMFGILVRNEILASA